MIRSNIEELGFNFEDIEILLTTQAHMDHVADLAALASLRAVTSTDGGRGPGCCMRVCIRRRQTRKSSAATAHTWAPNGSSKNQALPWRITPRGAAHTRGSASGGRPEPSARTVRAVYVCSKASHAIAEVSWAVHRHAESRASHTARPAALALDPRHCQRPRRGRPRLVRTAGVAPRRAVRARE